MRARALFVLQFVALIGGSGCVVAALSGQSWRLLALGALCLAAMIAIRAFLKRSGQWSVCVDDLNHAYLRPDPMPNHEEGSLRLMALLDRRDEIEARRGTAGFDPWELQVVRREIAAVLKENPSLAALLDDER